MRNRYLRLMRAKAIYACTAAHRNPTEENRARAEEARRALGVASELTRENHNG